MLEEHINEKKRDRSDAGQHIKGGPTWQVTRREFGSQRGQLFLKPGAIRKQQGVCGGVSGVRQLAQRLEQAFLHQTRLPQIGDKNWLPRDKCSQQMCFV